ncbi:hypothetical protein DRJ53_07990 [Paracnuella aquatica]|nr:hypothetical protein DRJ53_07990 [Paracnuella aquatica]
MTGDILLSARFINFGSMQTFQVNILNPKAAKLLQSLADLKLISISEQPENGFQTVVNRLRKKASAAPPSLEDITKEVEGVRSKRYAQRKA